MQIDALQLLEICAFRARRNFPVVGIALGPFAIGVEQNRRVRDPDMGIYEPRLTGRFTGQALEVLELTKGGVALAGTGVVA